MQPWANEHAASTTRTGRRRPPKGDAADGQQNTALAWLAVPALFFFLVFAVVPLAGVLVLSFTSWDGLGEIRLAGLANWITVLTDPVTGNALLVTVQDHVLLLHGPDAHQPPAGRLHGGRARGTGPRWPSCTSCRCCFPRPPSPSPSRRCWTRTSASAPGLGLPFLAQDWLGNSDLVLFVVVFVIAWQFVPFHTLIYQGGVRQIPTSLYEAAEIDGAGRVQQFFNITLPQLKYTIITSSTLMVVGSLTYFDLIFVLTGGGPGYSTRLLPLHMYLTGFGPTTWARPASSPSSSSSSAWPSPCSCSASAARTATQANWKVA